MRETSDGYIVGRTFWRLLTTLSPGLVFIVLLVDLLLGFGPGPHTPLFDVAVGLAIAFFAVGEWIIIAGFIRRPALLVTSATGVSYYPVRSDPYTVPWGQIATLGVHERLAGGTVMRSLVLTLRPVTTPGDDAPNRISLPAHQLPISAARCVQLLAERHREQIALNAITVFTEPQVSLSSLMRL